MQRFKGFSTEQTVNLLKGARREAELNYQGELIGREQELRQLENFAGPLWAGEFAGFLLVMGDAGIGKGRLFGVTHLKPWNGLSAAWILPRRGRYSRWGSSGWRT